MAHLSRPYDDRTREGIARALIDKAARPHLSDLIDAFEKEDDSKSHHVKWALGYALTVAGASRNLTDFIRLALDQRQGTARTALIPTLRRSRRPEAQAALALLANDPDPEIRITATQQKER